MPLSSQEGHYQEALRRQLITAAAVVISRTCRARRRGGLRCRPARSLAGGAFSEEAADWTALFDESRFRQADKAVARVLVVSDTLVMGSTPPECRKVAAAFIFYLRKYLSLRLSKVRIASQYKYSFEKRTRNLCSSSPSPLPCDACIRPLDRFARHLSTLRHAVPSGNAPARVPARRTTAWASSTRRTPSKGGHVAPTTC